MYSEMRVTWHPRFPYILETLESLSSRSAFRPVRFSFLKQ